MKAFVSTIDIRPQVWRGKQLQGVLLIEHRVIFGDATLVLDAQRARQLQVSAQGPIGGLRLRRRDAEAGVEAGQECGQHRVRFRNGRGPGEAQLTHQAVLEGPIDPLHAPFRLRAVGEDLRHAQLPEGASKLRGNPLACLLFLCPQGPVVLKDGMPVRVDRQGNPMALDDLLHKAQVAQGILLLLEERSGDSVSLAYDSVSD